MSNRYNDNQMNGTIYTVNTQELNIRSIERKMKRDKKKTMKQKTKQQRGMVVLVALAERQQNKIN